MDLEETLFELAPRLLRYCVARAADSCLGEEIAQETLTPSNGWCAAPSEGVRSGPPRPSRAGGRAS